MPDRDREIIIEWATAAKRMAECADLERVPRDESLMRAAVSLSMLTRGPFPAMRVVESDGQPDGFNRSVAIIMMALNIDDVPPGVPERAALFAEVLDV